MKSRLKNLLLTLWVQIRDLYLYLFRHAIIVNGYVDDHTWHGIRHRNWGDDLNYYFLKKLTGRPVVMYHNSKLAKLLHLKNYLCIGTLLDATNYSNSKTIVWGAGVCGADRDFTIPQKTLAVRGYKTIDFLKDRRYPYPKIVGDPALLLPLVYQPRVKFKVQSSKFKVSSSAFPSREGTSFETQSQELKDKRYHLGIIPHVVDLHHPVIEEIRKNHADEILIIDLAHYKKWTDVIDQIYSCDRIISSSLHGLIVSDAYQVPNCWIELSGKIAGGNFKYNDYASSVNRCFAMPIHIEKYANIADLVKHAEIYFSYAKPEKIKELQDGLIKVAPFKLVAFQHGRD